VLVIFGASGDLTQRKLMPALYNLALEDRLPERFSVIGYARSEITHEAFREKMRESVRQFSRTGLKDETVWNQFAGNLYYVRGGYEDPEGYHALKELIDGFEHGTRVLPVRLFYLATPPDLYGSVVERIAASGLIVRETGGESRMRVVIEKPFGTDLETARELNRRMHEALDESQIYRIDHYLGKETVQNLMVFRFANAVFEPVWNRRYVDHVQITAAETVGVENRGGYYDQAGVVRDMFQNHLLQLLTLTAMEPPVAFQADAVRDEKTKVLRAIRPIPPDALHDYTVRGQYGPGASGGRSVPGYREEPRVSPTSPAPTYAAVRLMIDNWRWQGVPFFLRSGKRMARRATEIAIQFKRPPHLLFPQTNGDTLAPNVLAIRVQPDEGISLCFEIKIPGVDVRMTSVQMDFGYAEAFGSTDHSAYETLLLDCMVGDATLFARSDGVEASWAVVDPIIAAWEARPPEHFPNYAAGSWGPAVADEFIARDGAHWRTP
jgi:glucose-6-phosphate 1-dehydrogenase